VTGLFPLPTTSAAGPRAADVVTALRRYRIPVSTEAAMQAAIGAALLDAGIPCRREVTREADRIDFVAGRVGIECKVAFSVTEVTRQLLRYAAWPELDELVLVTSRGKHLEISNSLGGKPVFVHVVRGLF
jgi:hypothetical protein